MTPKFKSVAIIGRQNNTKAHKTLLSLIKHLKNRKVKALLEKDTANLLNNTSIDSIPNNQLKHYCDIIIAIGGDGSLLSASRIAAKQNLPIMGINHGNLGFLTDINPKNLTKVNKILDGNFIEERRFLLSAEMSSQNKTLTKKLALNDVVLLSYAIGHMIEFKVYVNQEFLCKYRADGMIIATPTGSTAHALSSGGPILYPTLENIVLVPLLSHNLSSRSIVIDSESNIDITFSKSTDAIVLCDGQTQTMMQGGTIHINEAKEKLRLLHPNDYNYFETLRTKLNWEKENKNS